MLKVKVHAHSLRSDIYTIFNLSLPSLVKDMHYLNNLISPGRIQRTGHTSMQSSLNHSDTILVHQESITAGLAEATGMKSLLDTSTHDQWWEWHPRPFDLESYTLTTLGHMLLRYYIVIKSTSLHTPL